MATQKAIMSFDIIDAVGVKKSYADYITYDDATATLSTLQSYLQATAVLLDAITDGQLVESALKLSIALPGGLKGAPVAGSDVEEAGLFTYLLNVTPARAYGEVIPAIAQSILDGKKIITTAGAGQSWMNHQLNHALAGIPVDNRWAYFFNTLRQAQKKFRKSRRALSRS